MDAPFFRMFTYHPDPIATGSVVKSDEACVSCLRSRGYVYVSSLYSAREVNGHICPWCIADGSAAEKYDATFTDDAPLFNLAESIVDEVTRKTPGFTSWQQERWLTCCNDACAYIAGEYKLTLEYTDEFWNEVKSDLGFDGMDWNTYHKGILSGANALYVFKCRHCGKLHGYSDYT